MSYKSISWNEFRSFVFDELEEYFEVENVNDVQWNSKD